MEQYGCARVHYIYYDREMIEIDKLFIIHGIESLLC